jgi:hypothetical protein
MRPTLGTLSESRLWVSSEEIFMVSLMAPPTSSDANLPGLRFARVLAFGTFFASGPWMKLVAA